MKDYLDQINKIFGDSMWHTTHYYSPTRCPASEPLVKFIPFTELMAWIQKKYPEDFKINKEPYRVYLDEHGLKITQASPTKEKNVK